ncbi:MAG: tetratricopeptide (TPR) repeat protein [Crocinitomicaceae bacterium]|jgi:tetratricopeptide (TPR) repeat protein
MTFSEDKFKEHIKQVVATQNKDSDRSLTLDELKELAESMGVSESEWNELMLKAEVSLNTGLAHLKVQNYTDAIASAEEATSINPYIKDGNAILAQSYYKLGIVDKNDDLFIQAEHYARMELKNDPLDSIALNVLSAIENIRKEGKYSGKLIKTIIFVIGGILLIFFLLYMCNDSLQEKSVREIIREETNQTDDDRLTGLQREAKKLEASYIQAIETRNEHALEVVGSISDYSLKRNFKEAVLDYDTDKIMRSEQNYRLVLSEVKNHMTFSTNTRITLEGDDNRINIAKKRYVESVAAYNSTLDGATTEKSFEEIEPRK